MPNPAASSISQANTNLDQDLVLITGSAEGIAGNGTSYVYVNGNQIYIDSNANNLVPGDDLYSKDIFVKNLASGVITPITPLGGGTSYSFLDATSEGTAVLLSSYGNVYLKDMITGVMQIVDTTAAGQPGNGSYFSAGYFLADDPYKVVFSLWGGDLTQPAQGTEQVYVKDLATGDLTVVSSSTAGVIGNDLSSLYGASSDGTRIYLWSAADNLVAGDTNHGEDVFMKDLTTGVMTQLTSSSAGVAANAHCSPDYVDDDVLVFDTTSSNLDSHDTLFTGDVFLKNIKTGNVTTVSSNSAGQIGNANSNGLAASHGAKTVVFTSSATNLVANDTNEAQDIFLKDMATGATTRIFTPPPVRDGSSVSYSAKYIDHDSKIALQINSYNFQDISAAQKNGGLAASTVSIYIIDLATQTSTLLTSGAYGTLYAAGGTSLGAFSDSYYLADVMPDTEHLVLSYNQASLTSTVGSVNAYSASITATSLSKNAGDSLDNVLTGHAGTNYMFGFGGNDTLNGNTGNDVLSGGAGADTFVFGHGSGQDTIVDFAAEDTIDVSGASGFSGYLGLEQIGADTLVTFSDNDTLLLQNVTSTTLSAANFKYAAGVAPISGTSGDDILTGTSGDDVIGGLGGNDILNGLAGNDTLNGGTGNDTMAGGAGDDTYYVDNELDTVTESEGQGHDTVISSWSFILQANVEELTLVGGSNLHATGNGLVNVLIGNTGNNVLDGGSGADIMIGGLGDDIYYVDNSADVVSEEASSGNDTVVATVSYTLSANTEALTLAGTGNIDATGNRLANVLIGTRGNNVLDGQSGADLMIGGEGDDTYMVDDEGDVVIEGPNTGKDTVVSSLYSGYTLGADIENLILVGPVGVKGTGNALDNYIKGNNSYNVLDGGAGADIMVGGLGNDTYYVDNAGDVVTENAREGSDLVISSISYSLGANVEDLTLTGTAAINATGNSLVNGINGNDGNNIIDGGGGADFMFGGSGNDTYYVDNTSDHITEFHNGGIDTVISSRSYTLSDNVEKLTLTGVTHIAGTGNALANVIIGNDGDNHLSGLAGNDTLSGGLGNDTLDGGKGADIMKGGAGDDRYYVENTGDLVTEYSNSGHDTVVTTLNYALGANVEDLIQVGTHDYYASGNALDNHLTGNIGNNLFHGGDGDDVIDGGKGADKMYGGLGNDIFYVDNVGDVIVEYTGQGTDTVISTITYTLGGAVENLTLSGATNINGTGTNGDNVLIGNDGSNLLTGGKGHDILTGGLGADTFVFGPASGADTITDFSASQGDKIDLSAWHAQSTAIIHQDGANTTIDLGGGNIVTLTGVTATDAVFLSHITW